MKFLSQPKTILLIVSLLVIFSGAITAGSYIDIHFHDTMFVINNLYLGLLIGGFFLMESVVYFLTSKYRQSRGMQYLHVASIILILLAFLFPEDHPYSYYDLGALYQISIFVILLVVFFALGQVLFIFNLITGFIRGKKQYIQDSY